MARRGQLIPTRAALAERTARYAELRDEGNDTWDAAREIDLADSTRQAYERWYREVRGLPRRGPGIPRRGGS